MARKTKPIDADQKYCSPRQAAKVLGCSEYLVYRECVEGNIPCRRVGKRILISVDWVNGEAHGLNNPARRITQSARASQPGIYSHRKRGDRPKRRRNCAFDAAFPPQARGSTCDPNLLRLLMLVSPAHAGIGPRMLQ